MIIFDLDGTLADCEHRRHFVDPKKQPGYMIEGYDYRGSLLDEESYRIDDKKWKPDWKAFYKACDKDGLIIPVSNAFCLFGNSNRFKEVEVWSGRCESVKEKTIDWLYEMMPYHAPKQVWSQMLKMRPIGDNTPDDQLKERWLDAALAEGKKIDFVFDDRPKVVRMWRRRGVFVFDVNQTGKEF